VALVVLLALLAPAGALRARAASPDEPVTLSFQDADLDVVLDAIAQEVGFNYILAPEVRRKVTVQGRVPRKELFDLLLSILEVHGLTAVKAGDVYKIVRIAAAQAQGLPVVVGLEPDPTRRPEEIVTQLVHLRYGAAAEIARVLQPMVAREAAFAVHRDTNVLVITDSVEKLRRYLSVIRISTSPRPRSSSGLPLRFADATAPALPDHPARRRPRPGARPSRPPGAARRGTAEAVAIAAPARDGGAGRPVILADGHQRAPRRGAPAVLERIQAPPPGSTGSRPEPGCLPPPGRAPAREGAGGLADRAPSGAARGPRAARRGRASRPSAAETPPGAPPPPPGRRRSRARGPGHR
jgi:hypothetical protein